MLRTFVFLGYIGIVVFFTLLAIYMGYIVGMNRRLKTKPDAWRGSDCDCASCAFQERFRCRRFPPSVFWKWGAAAYPKVWIKDPDGITQYWQSACAEYKRRQP